MRVIGGTKGAVSCIVAGLITDQTGCKVQERFTRIVVAKDQGSVKGVFGICMHDM